MGKVEYTVSRPDPLYLAWKKAMNEWCSNNGGVPWIEAIHGIKNETGCLYVKMHRLNNGYIGGVTLAFDSEEDMSWFLLRYS